MNLIDRYLAAVAAQLPSDQREDIIAELRDLILTRFEEKEEALGRPLEAAEQEEILREIGHPLVVAARYRQGPDALVGPELYPYWLFAVKAGLLLVLVVQGIRLVIQMVSAQTAGGAVADFIHGVIGDGLTLVGLATVVVALLEHYRIRPRWLGRWRTEDLEAYGLWDPAAWSGRKAPDVPGAPAEMQHQPSRTSPGGEHVLSLMVLGAFVLWWIGVFHLPAFASVALPGDDAQVRGAPIWSSLHGLILVYALAQITYHVSGLVWPNATRLQGAASTAIAAAGLWLTLNIFAAGHWFTLERDGETAPIAGDASLLHFEALGRLGGAGRDLAGVAANLSVVATWVLAMIALSLLVQLVHGFWRLARG